MRFRIAVVGLLVALAAGSSAPLAQEGGIELSVMTRNQYFGGDLPGVASATDEASFYAAARALLVEIAANNFPERAQALAREIADRRPHVVALQEPYLDAWLQRPGLPAGYTCCDDKLSSNALTLTERKDVIVTRERPVSLKANIFGNDPADKTPSGLWPSDHAGLFVRFVF
jgi:hypothetical protein